MELEEFKNAKCIEVNPDKPQEAARVIVLENQKELFVPIPRLAKGFMKHITPVNDENKNGIKWIVNRKGLESNGEVVDINSNIEIDLLIVGSVAVSKEGYRIGKGRGYADLEYAILSEMKAINEETIIITVVHDSQVYIPKNHFMHFIRLHSDILGFRFFTLQYF